MVVEVGHVGAVNPAHHERPRPVALPLPEKGAQLVAHTDTQLVGQPSRHNHLVARALGRQTEKPSLLHAAGEESRVEPATHSPHQHPLNLVFGLHHPALVGKKLHMFHALGVADTLHLGTPHVDRRLFVSVAHGVALHHDMSAEAHRLAANLALETTQHTHGHHHHRHAQRHAPHCHIHQRRGVAPAFTPLQG